MINNNYKGDEIYMKSITITERQEMVLKSLLISEIDYLEKEAISSEKGIDKKGLEAELRACKELLEQLK